MPSQLITVEDIPVTLTRKSMKNIRLAVKSNTGEVRLSAPHHVSLATLKSFLFKQLPWLRTQQDAYRARNESQPPQYTDGECHYLWGEEKALHFCDRNTSQGDVDNLSVGKIRLKAPKNTPKVQTQAVGESALFSLYRKELENAMGVWVPYYEERMSLSADEWRIRRMKTRWGSCNIQRKRIWLNLYLAAYPIRCLQYVIVHELAHLVEAGHNARFWAIVDTYFPEWREVRSELNRRQLVWC